MKKKDKSILASRDSMAKPWGYSRAWHLWGTANSWVWLKFSEAVRACEGQGWRG